MTALAGYGGAVKIAANTVAEIDKWDLNIDADIYDTTAFGGTGWKTMIPGLRKWSGSFAGRLFQGDTNGQAILQTDLLTGVVVTLLFYIDGTHNYTGSALVKQEQVKTAVNATVDVTYSFEGTGAVTYS